MRRMGIDADQIRKAVALGELMDLARGSGLVVSVNDEGQVIVVDGGKQTRIGDNLEEAVMTIRRLLRPQTTMLTGEITPLGRLN